MKNKKDETKKYCETCKHFNIFRNKYYQCKYYEKKGYVMALSGPDCVACEKYAPKEGR